MSRNTLISNIFNLFFLYRENIRKTYFLRHPGHPQLFPIDIPTALISRVFAQHEAASPRAPSTPQRRQT